MTWHLCLASTRGRRSPAPTEVAEPDESDSFVSSAVRTESIGIGSGEAGFGRLAHSTAAEWWSHRRSSAIERKCSNLIRFSSSLVLVWNVAKKWGDRYKGHSHLLLQVRYKHGNRIDRALSAVFVRRRGLGIHSLAPLARLQHKAQPHDVRSPHRAWCDAS